jgi:2-dehydropantoate 2-reductase
LYQTDANMKALRLTVIGGGSVGMAIAASFAIAGAQATLLVRAASMEVLRSQGIRVTGVLGNHTIPPGLIYIDDADNANSSSLDCDVLVVATKAYQVADVPHSMHRILPPTSLCSSGSKPAVTRQKFGAPSVRYSSPSIRRLKPRVVCWLAKYLLFDHYLSILEVVAFF